MTLEQYSKPTLNFRKIVVCVFKSQRLNRLSARMATIEIKETDEVGRPTATYLVSSASSRVDIVPSTNQLSLAQRLLAIFLPAGYPHTVSSDYTPYQIYDSLQAFFSAIAGLLASRAVLQGLGVGDENASATAAMLLSIAQESLGRFATIFFAHWASRRIESDCKSYRLLADVVNDFAFAMDCLSPSLPKPVRIPFLCAASMCRAICGVAGGSSKAILSAHFARANNIGELNAKDSSQETVISLLGMWAGGFVVSKVHGGTATWIWLLCLLGLHLTTNYLAVSSVSMTTLNRQRGNIVFSSIRDARSTLNPQEVVKQERIFERDGILRWQGSSIGYCKFANMRELLASLGGKLGNTSGSVTDIATSFPSILDIFAKESYIMWFAPKTKQALIVLKAGATSQTELYAWWHALRVAHAFDSAKYKQEEGTGELLKAIQETLSNEYTQTQLMAILEAAGWDISKSLMQTTSGTRLHLAATADAEEFKQSPIG